MRGAGDADWGVRRATCGLALAVALAGCATSVEDRYQAATLARRGGDVESAIAGYRRVLALEPRHAAAHVYLAYLLGVRGDHEGAVEHYGAGLEGTGTDLEQLRAVTVIALNNLAYTLAERGESLEEAETLARRALELSPDRARLLDTLAFVLLKRGGEREARRLLERATELTPEDYEIQEHLADAYLADGDADAARAALAEALASRPASPERVRHLEGRLRDLGGPAAADDTAGPTARAGGALP